MEKTPKFIAGKNIAMKVPSHEFSRTAAFYRDILKLPLVEAQKQSIVFDFGGKRLWLDTVEHLSQAEIWLEIQTADIDAAKEYFCRHGVVFRDAIEPLPQGFKGFWIANPADIIHLVSGE